LRSILCRWPVEAKEAVKGLRGTAGDRLILMVRLTWAKRSTCWSTIGGAATPIDFDQ
tara:strand:- start:46210 stop:46380 length:171 start_codon:yes stop_codon:yes gene_type:complete